MATPSWSHHREKLQGFAARFPAAICNHRCKLQSLHEIGLGGEVSCSVGETAVEQRTIVSEAENQKLLIWSGSNLCLQIRTLNK